MRHGRNKWGHRSRVTAVAVLASLELVLACAGVAGSGFAGAEVAPARSATPQAPARTILVGPDVTDPYMLEWHGRYYIYNSTGLSYMNVPVRVGRQPGAWGKPIDALPKLPSWASPPLTWAPDVYRVAGGWALYFTGLLSNRTPLIHCIGAAFSSSPTGPFVATDRPFICQLNHRGSIDPRVIAYRGGLVMLWKSDDNANPEDAGPDQNGKTGIYAQDLSPDGHALFGRRVKIFGPSEPWEGNIVEAPDMVSAQGTYWLFFSGNWYSTPSYGIGVAACKSPFGPCTDRSTIPFIGSNLQGQGPGEESLFQNASGIYVLYNPFRANDPGPVIPRPAVMARIGFTRGGPYLAAPATN